MKDLPDLRGFLVVRNPTSDESAWLSSAAIEAPVGEFHAYVSYVSDPDFAGLSSSGSSAFAGSARPHRSFIFVVDRLSRRTRGIHSRPGPRSQSWIARPFAWIPRWSVENNLDPRIWISPNLLPAAPTRRGLRGFPNVRVITSPSRSGVDRNDPLVDVGIPGCSPARMRKPRSARLPRSNGPTISPRSSAGIAVLVQPVLLRDARALPTRVRHRPGPVNGFCIVPHRKSERFAPTPPSRLHAVGKKDRTQTTLLVFSKALLQRDWNGNVPPEKGDVGDALAATDPRTLVASRFSAGLPSSQLPFGKMSDPAFPQTSRPLTINTIRRTW